MSTIGTHRITRRLAPALAAGLVVLGAGIAQADPTPANPTPTDQRYIDAVAQLNIPFASGVDIPGQGHQICEMISSGRKQTVDPVRTIRGVVQTLQNSGMSRGQAVALMKLSVAAYCPEHTAITGR